MRKTTTSIHLAALTALAIAASLLAAPVTASAQTQTQTQTPTTSSTGGNTRLAAGLIATRQSVQVRGVNPPSVRPNVCNTNPTAFRGCRVF